MSRSSSSSSELPGASAPGHPGYDIGQNFTSALAIGLAAMLCTFALLAFYFCRYVSLGRRQQREQQENQQGGDRDQMNSSSMSLEELPVFSTLEELRNREGELKKIVVRGGESCAVCLAELAHENPSSSLRIRLLPLCGHCFHCDCVDEWLKVHMICPTCRTSLRSSSSPCGKSSSCLVNSLVVGAPGSSSSVVRVVEQPELSRVQVVVVQDHPALKC